MQQGLNGHSRASPGPGLGALRVDQDDGRVDVEADGQRLGAADGDVDDLRHDVDTWQVDTGVRLSWVARRVHKRTQHKQSCSEVQSCCAHAARLLEAAMQGKSTEHV